MSERIGRALRRSGLGEALLPVEMLRQHRATGRVIDPVGAIKGEAAAPFRTPCVFHWHIGGALATGARGGVQACPHAGVVARLDAHVEAAPGVEGCTVALTRESEGAGRTPFVTVAIEEGARTGSSTVAERVPAGAWLGIDVERSGGAADLSVTATVQME